MALAGFSGLEIGIKKDTRELHRSARQAWPYTHFDDQRNCDAFFSLLPSALTMAGVPGNQYLAFANMALATMVLLACLAIAVASFKTRPRYPWSFWPLMVANVALASEVLFNAFGDSVNTGGYSALLLLWLLVVGFAQFFTFLILTWSSKPTN